MSRWIYAVMLYVGYSSAALAQTGSNVNSGLNGTGGLTGANVNTVNGMTANGTPFQQLPGSSMTNGAGNSAMTPGLAGKTTPPNLTLPAGTVNGTTTGTINTGPSQTP